MSHTPHCIRSDGDWFCAPGCTHDRDEERAKEHALACAAADAWMEMPEIKRDEVLVLMSKKLHRALFALHDATHSSPLRKVKP